MYGKRINTKKEFEHYEELAKELIGEHVFLEQADSRCGNRMAIVFHPTYGGEKSTGISLISDFLTHNEMKYFLRGIAYQKHTKKK